MTNAYNPGSRFRLSSPYDKRIDPVTESTNLDPAQYDNYDPTPRYLDETRRAAQIMSGSGAGTASGGLLPDHQDSFDDRYGKWGSYPAGTAPLSASDRPASFNNRFGNWGSVPAGDFRQSSFAGVALVAKLQEIGGSRWFVIDFGKRSTSGNACASARLAAHRICS